MEERIGRQFGSYRLVRLLGQGSFAGVYLGEHIHLGTQAAIKILHTQLAARDMEQFRAEAYTIALLEHPHVVRILDFGVAGTTPFLVMGYAPSGSLRDHYPKGTRLPLPTIVSYVKQIADALQYAHDEKVVHRDIKPENILLGRRNDILLGDFGIALIVQSSRYQSTKDMAGTVAYMAPEQIEAHPQPASDQYSLGIVVYEWLSGERPFQGTFTEIALKHHMVPPPPLRDRVPELPMEVEQTVMRALAKDPQQRFPRVQDFAIALERASAATLPVNIADTPPIHQAVEIAYPANASQTELPTELASPLEETQKAEESVKSSQQTVSAPSGQANFLPTSTTRRGESTSMPAVATPPERPQAYKRTARVMTLLLVGIAFLVIIGSGGFFFITNSIKQANILSAQQTQAARATLQIPTQPAYLAATATTQASLDAATTIATARLNPYAPQQAKLVLDDPLKDNSQGHGWEETRECQFSHNAYHILAPSPYTVTCMASSTNFADFTYQVDVTLLKGDLGDPRAGNSTTATLIFRASTSNLALPRGYYFEVGINSHNYLTLYNNGNSFQPLVYHDYTSALHQGLHVTNTLAIRVQGNTISAYINGQHITGPFSDSTFSSGSIGLEVSAGNHDADVAFTNAKVWTS